MPDIKHLDHDSLRDTIDARECYDALRHVVAEARHSFGGSMKFERRGNAEYLIRRPYGSTTKNSLGRRSADTETILSRFLDGQMQAREQIERLRSEISRLAPVLRARGAGRVPLLTARVIRKLDSLGLMGPPERAGGALTVIGTSALYAYEARAGLRIGSALLATGDLDLLHDARRSLALSGRVGEKGLVGALQRVDRSFRKVPQRSFTAVNGSRFMVDLVAPADHERIMREGQGGLSDHPDDLVASAIDNGEWLLNAPKFTATALDEQGFPLRIVTVDPRVYALQKQWMVEEVRFRDPLKRRRDREQAQLVAAIATGHLGLAFDDPDLSALPAPLLAFASRFTADRAVSSEPGPPDRLDADPSPP